jgi:hypothetical protein
LDLCDDVDEEGADPEVDDEDEDDDEDERRTLVMAPGFKDG